MRYGNSIGIGTTGRPPSGLACREELVHQRVLGKHGCANPVWVLSKPLLCSSTLLMVADVPPASESNSGPGAGRARRPRVSPVLPPLRALRASWPRLSEARFQLSDRQELTLPALDLENSLSLVFLFLSRDFLPRRRAPEMGDTRGGRGDQGVPVGRESDVREKETLGWQRQ